MTIALFSPTAAKLAIRIAADTCRSDSRLFPPPSAPLRFLAQYPVPARCQPMQLIVQRILQILRQALVHGLVHSAPLGPLVSQCILHPVPRLVEFLVGDDVLRDQQQAPWNIEADPGRLSRP